MREAGEVPKDQEEEVPKDKAGSGVSLRTTKHKLKASRSNGKLKDKGQPLFNDPLYEYLDN